MKTTTNDMMQEEKNVCSNPDLGSCSVDGGLAASKVIGGHFGYRNSFHPPPPNYLTGI